MLATNWPVCVKYALLFLYLMVLGVLLVLLTEADGDLPPAFLLSRSEVTPGATESILSFFGENLPPELDAILVENLLNEESLLWQPMVGAPSRALDVQGSLLLASSRADKLVSVAINENAEPVLLGSLFLPGNINTIEIAGNVALVGQYIHQGVSLIDIDDPQAMKLIKHLPLPGYITSFAAGPEGVYFTDIHAGVGRIDLAGEESSAEIVAPMESPWRLSRKEDRLAIATLKGKVNLFEIVSKGTLAEVGVLEHPHDVRGVALGSSFLAVALADGTLLVYNLSSWPKLREPATLDLHGTPMFLEPVPDREQLAVSLVNSGLVLIDVAQPERPLLVGQNRTPKTFHGLKFQSRRVYGTSRNGLEVFSQEAMETGPHLDWSKAIIEDGYSELWPWNGHVYGYRNGELVDFTPSAVKVTQSPLERYLTVTDSGGVSIFEQRDHEQLHRVGSRIPLPGARRAIFSERYLYATDNESLRVFSANLPEEPVELSRLSLPGQLQTLTVLRPGFLLVGSHKMGIQTVDVRNPQRPVVVAELVSPPHLQSAHIVQDLLVDGYYAYVAYGVGGIHVFDMEDPVRPRLMQIINTPGIARQLAVYEDLLLVADGASGVFVIDLKDRNSPVACGSWLMPAHVEGLAVAGDSLVVSGRAAGTMKMPLPRRLPQLEVFSKGEARVTLAGLGRGRYRALLYNRTGADQVTVNLD